MEKTKTIITKMDTIKMLKFPSKKQNLQKVEPFVNQLVQAYGLCSDIYGNILISLTEAVNNAIMHGNKEDENKEVLVKSFKMDHRLAIQVLDQGNGFDYESVPDPTAPENILNIRGRGVFIMKQLADKIVFDNDGSLVEMHFNLKD